LSIASILLTAVLLNGVGAKILRAVPYALLVDGTRDLILHLLTCPELALILVDNAAWVECTAAKVRCEDATVIGVARHHMVLKIVPAMCSLLALNLVAIVGLAKVVAEILAHNIA
jgi:hypothetical protein